MKELVMYDNPTMDKKLEQYLLSKIPNYHDVPLANKCRTVQKLVSACKSCGLHYCSNYQNVAPILNPECKFLFIGRNPNGTEARENKLFPEGTKQGYVFRKYLELLGIGQGEMSVINMCYCYAKGNRPPTQEEISKCVVFKKLELEAIGTNVRIIFAMGQDSLKWLYGLNHPGAMQCNGDIYLSELNGKGVYVVPILHPSHIMIDTTLAPETFSYLEKLAKLVVKVREIEESENSSH